MPLLVVGSVALDSVETPSDRRDDILGGSAVYFSYAASYFTSVRLVGVVGEDWPPEHTALLDGRGIDEGTPADLARTIAKESTKTTIGYFMTLWSRS